MRKVDSSGSLARMKIGRVFPCQGTQRTRIYFMIRRGAIPSVDTPAFSSSFVYRFWATPACAQGPFLYLCLGVMLDNIWGNPSTEGHIGLN